MTENHAQVSTKLPRSIRDQFVAQAKHLGVTTSARLRRLVELDLAGAPDDEAGPVETAVRTQLADRVIEETSARAAAALNLARRMDRDPVAGAQNAAQLRILLDALMPARDSDPDELTVIVLSAVFTRLGWQLLDDDGHPVDLLLAAQCTDLLDALR